MTIRIIVIGADMPDSGLHLDMSNPYASMLTTHDVMLANGSADIHPSTIQYGLSRYLISEAVRQIHASVGEKLFEGVQDANPPAMSIIDKLANQKTEFYQFGANFENEGTISGTYGVHNNIFRDQLNLSDAHLESGRRWLVHGDQLTVQRILSGQIEQSKSY